MYKAISMALGQDPYYGYGYTPRDLRRLAMCVACRPVFGSSVLRLHFQKGNSVRQTVRFMSTGYPVHNVDGFTFLVWL
jgi:hypothetical protein